MNRGELAAMLNGREYRKEMTREEEREAMASGLVVVFGASDDLLEFRGLINDEVGAYEGACVLLTPDGLLQRECDDDNCPHFKHIADKAVPLEQLWCAEGDAGPSWTYKTDISHDTFTIMDDGEPYCRGIVFYLADVAMVLP